MIDRKIWIEELLDILPGAITYLAERGIKCMACGEPIWGTLEEAAREKGFGEQEIQQFVRDLNELLPDS